MSMGFVRKSLAPKASASCLALRELSEVKTSTGTNVPEGTRERSCLSKEKPSTCGILKSIATKSGWNSVKTRSVSLESVTLSIWR